jgi:Na+-driven multidrug efflux pump
MFIIGLGLTFGSGASSYISRLLGEGETLQANRTALMGKNTENSAELLHEN